MSVLPAKTKDDSPATEIESFEQEIRQIETQEARIEEKRSKPQKVAKPAAPHWLFTMIVPALVTGAISFFSGYFLSGSASQNKRDRIRKEVFDKYFEIDNTIAGKRIQMLKYIEEVLAPDDPEIKKWLITEKGVVENLLDEYKKEIEKQERQILELSKQIDSLETQVSAIENAPTSNKKTKEKIENLRRKIDLKHQMITKKKQDLNKSVLGRFRTEIDPDFE